jgi:hypothetical protein
LGEPIFHWIYIHGPPPVNPGPLLAMNVPRSEKMFSLEFFYFFFKQLLNLQGFPRRAGGKQQTHTEKFPACIRIEDCIP